MVQDAESGSLLHALQRHTRTVTSFCALARIYTLKKEFCVTQNIFIAYLLLKQKKNSNLDFLINKKRKDFLYLKLI